MMRHVLLPAMFYFLAQVSRYCLQQGEQKEALGLVWNKFDWGPAQASRLPSSAAKRAARYRKHSAVASSAIKNRWGYLLLPNLKKSRSVCDVAEHCKSNWGH